MLAEQPAGHVTTPIMPAIEACEPVEIEVAPIHLVRTTRKLPK